MRLYSLFILFLFSTIELWSQKSRTKITLKGFQEKEGFNIYFNDSYQSKKHLISFSRFKQQEIEISEPTLFYKADQIGIPFLIYPGESLEIIKDGQYFTAIITGNQVLCNELKLLRELVLKNGPLITSTASNGQAHSTAKDDARKFDVSVVIKSYQKKLAFVDTFGMRNEISDDFKRLIRSYLYYNLLDHSIDILFQAKEPVPKYEGLARWLKDADLSCQDSTLLCIDRYRAFLLRYNIYLSISAGKGSDFLSQAETACLNFSGKARDYLLFIITKRAYYKNDVSLNSIMQFFYANCKTIEYIQAIKEQETLRLEGNYIDVNEFIVKDSTAITFLSVINKTNAKLIYLDLWASWCIPCLEEMPYAKKLQDRYFGNGDIAFVYVSLDSSNSIWQKGLNQMMKLSKSKYNYRLTNNFDSRFAKSFSINSIPRYMIVDSNGKILNADAPRPSDPAIHIELANYLKAIN